MRSVGSSKFRWFPVIALVAACTANSNPGGGGFDDVPSGGDGADGGDGRGAVDADVTPADNGSTLDVTSEGVTPLDVTTPPDAAAEAGTDASVGDAPVDRCAEDIDTDNDRITNAEECRLGTDPFNPDTDRDGALDGQEIRYPRGCISPRSSTQRRPPPRCTMDSECMTGEVCRGLDPRSRDSDGDGVDDGLEDRNLDGVIDTPRGETDPRLTDSDGDGRGDGTGGLEICRPAGLATVTQLGLPGAEVQAGFDPRWGTARRAMGTMGRSGVMMDDAAANISAGVFNYPVTGDLRAEASRAESLMVAGLGGGAAAVLVGRSFTTHEMNEAVTSTYRVARATAASTLRDGVAQSMLGMAVATGPAVVGMSSEFLVDVTTVRRTMGRLGRNTVDVVVTLAPRTEYEDNTRQTSIRAIDLVNATATAELDKGLGANCQVFRAAQPPTADFLWTVDTSGSMGPYQMRLGNTAVQFFNRLRAAGVDFRVGVFNAGSAAPNLDTPGFRWIPGTDMNGARRLCEEVTSAGLGTCPTSPADSFSPYPMPGDSETPTAAAVVLHDLFRRRAAMGETNPERRFREGAQVITFHVTDEPGTNDWSRAFNGRVDPMTSMPWGTSYGVGLPNVVSYFQRNRILTFGLVSNTGGSGALPVGGSPVPCSANREVDLPRCVIEGNRGAYIPIATATDAEVSAAMTRIVEAIAGASSPFILERTPITSTIQVRVRGRAVPRSRSAGFDYDAVSRAVVFYGDMYRPAMGDEVVVSYRLWQPCPGAGDVCVTDSDCCAPTVCRARRCQPPCRPLDAMCTTDADCCAPNACIMGACRPRPMCVPTGGRCTPSELRNDCCPPDICRNGACGQCANPGETCTTNSDCCGGSPCMAGRCACRPTAGRCTSPSDCCSRYCIEGLCGPG
jgi:hypothetical protein